MLTLIRTLRLLSVVVWIGGIIFFAFVLAPVAFHLLPSQHMAGIVVGGTLRALDIIGLVCGLIFCAATMVFFRRSSNGTKRRHEIEILLAALMILGTAYLHAGILPAMEVDRAAAGGDIETAPNASPTKMHFEELHKRSERVEGAVLFGGLGLIILMAGESLPTQAKIVTE